MAVYQYYLEVVPKEGIEIKHNSIPNEIGVSTETGYFKSDVEKYWKEVEIKVDDIVSEVDLIIKGSRLGTNKTSIYWKSDTNQVDNDAAIYFDEESLGVRNFSFRSDLREKDFIFLKNMINLGKEKEWLFMDRKGKLMNPNFEEIKKSIQNSNALKFLRDPVKFLENIENKNK